MTPMPSTQDLSQTDVGQLLLEVERYLAAVEAFRSEGCEPAWQTETPLPLCA
jgi:hypothetical protein